MVCLRLAKQFFLFRVDAESARGGGTASLPCTTVAGIAGTVVGGGYLCLVLCLTRTGIFPAGIPVFGEWRGSVLLANPDVTTANVAILALSNGTAKTVTLSVPGSRASEPVSTDAGNGMLVAMKVTVTNNVGIVAERQQFFKDSSLTPMQRG